jgi:hypothetical protein
MLFRRRWPRLVESPDLGVGVLAARLPLSLPAGILLDRNCELSFGVQTYRKSPYQRVPVCERLGGLLPLISDDACSSPGLSLELARPEIRRIVC